MTLLCALAGCNSYELFRVAGPSPEGPRAADVLFVIDDSESMREESVSLAEGFSEFVASLTADDQGLVDWRIALTTTDAAGRAGELLGSRPVLARGEPDAADRFVETLLCEAACFSDRELVTDDPGFECAEPGRFSGEVSRQSLDCLCGAGEWLEHCAAGNEAPLEVVLDAMCRTARRLPDEGCEEVPAGERSAVDGFLRDEAVLVPVVVTDEGDGSPRLRTLEAWPGRYGELYSSFEVGGEPARLSWAAVAPTLDADYEPRCPGLAQSWGIQRLRYLVEGSGGLYEDVYAEDCGPRDLSQVLASLGDHLRRGGGAVRLPSEPIPETIAVVVGGRGVAPAELVGEDVFGQPVFGDGWQYLPETRTVIVHGDAAPVGDDAVEVYYRPVAAR